MLNEHPGVADSWLVGLADERWGELVAAYVLAAAAGRLTRPDRELILMPEWSA